MKMLSLQLHQSRDFAGLPFFGAVFVGLGSELTRPRHRRHMRELEGTRTSSELEGTRTSS